MSACPMKKVLPILHCLVKSNSVRCSARLCDVEKRTVLLSDSISTLNERNEINERSPFHPSPSCGVRLRLYLESYERNEINERMALARFPGPSHGGSSALGLSCAGKPTTSTRTMRLARACPWPTSHGYGSVAFSSLSCQLVSLSLEPQCKSLTRLKIRFGSIRNPPAAWQIIL